MFEINENSLKLSLKKTLQIFFKISFQTLRKGEKFNAKHIFSLLSFPSNFQPLHHSKMHIKLSLFYHSHTTAPFSVSHSLSNNKMNWKRREKFTLIMTIKSRERGMKKKKKKGFSQWNLKRQQESVENFFASLDTDFFFNNTQLCGWFSSASQRVSILIPCWKRL